MKSPKPKEWHQKINQKSRQKNKTRKKETMFQAGNKSKRLTEW